MTEALEPVGKLIFISDATGAPVTGLALVNFTILAVYKAIGASVSAWTHGSTITDMAALLGASYNGYYYWEYAAPPVGDTHFGIDIKPVSDAHYLRFATITGEMETKDILSVFNAANKPVVTISGSGTIGQVTALILVAKRYREITFTFVDSNGNNIDMTDGTLYENYQFSVRAKTDQTLTPPKYDQTANIVGGNGFVTIKILENASFFNYINEGATPETDKDVLYELTADLVTAPGETVSLVQSSPLTIIRREVGT